MPRWWPRREKSPQTLPMAADADAARCGACTLAACARGCRAAVLRMECEGDEAHQLRSLGVYEGAHVRVLDYQHGLLLDVAGARLAMGAALASSITVVPLGG